MGTRTAPFQLSIVSVQQAAAAALLLPALSRAKEQGKSAYCMNSLHQIDIAMKLYEEITRAGCTTARPGSLPTTASGI